MKLRRASAEKHTKKPLREGRGGSGAWIRTTIRGFKVRCPAFERRRILAARGRARAESITHLRAKARGRRAKKRRAQAVTAIVVAIVDVDVVDVGVNGDVVGDDRRAVTASPPP